MRRSAARSSTRRAPERGVELGERVFATVEGGGGRGGGGVDQVGEVAIGKGEVAHVARVKADRRVGGEFGRVGDKAGRIAAEGGDAQIEAEGVVGAGECRQQPASEVAGAAGDEDARAIAGHPQPFAKAGDGGVDLGGESGAAVMASVCPAAHGRGVSPAWCQAAGFPMLLRGIERRRGLHLVVIAPLG